MDNTREELEKAIKHFKCERDGAIVVLDSGFGSRPGESDLLYRNRKERAQIAIDAIEKQIPKSCCNRFYGDGSVEYVCPTCESAVNDDQKYCDACGQALDWEDVE